MASDIAVRPATVEDLAEVFGVAQSTEVLIIDGVISAVGVMMRRNDGRLFAHLEIIDVARCKASGPRFVRALRSAFLKTADRPLYAGCWEGRYATAPRLLSLLGFKETAEVRGNGNRVWILP